MGGVNSTEQHMSDVDFNSYTGRRYTREVPGTADATHGPAYEVPAQEPVDEAQQTLYHNFLRGWQLENGSRPCYGQRVVDPATGQAGPYEWLTYDQVKTRSEHVASGLTQLCGLARQDKVGVFSKNQLEWCLVGHACDRMSYVLVPLYDTLGPDAVPYVINHTELRVLCCGQKQLDVILQRDGDCKSLKTVVLFETATQEQREKATAKGVVLKSLAEVETLGENEPLEADPPLPTDVSTLCYTSGTEGAPKGVVLLQRNFAYVVTQASERLEIRDTDRYFSYLPLVHVLERVVVALMHMHGASTGFYQGDLHQLMDDVAELSPTLFVSVPRLLNRVYDTITHRVAAKDGLARLTFDQAFASKHARLAGGHKSHALWDPLVFSKIRQVLGGRVRLIFSGSAPLSAEVKEFLKIVFCCEVVEGYGLSESAGAVAVGAVDMPLGAHVGTPVMYSQIRLEDVAEMGYTSHDRPRPRGEILVRGPQMFQGYYKDEAKTREAIDEGGWFHTGDIGCWNADGTLSIVDRKKNIFKLSQGEYVAVEKIENVYSKSLYVAQIFVYGDSLKSCLVAVVVPDPKAAKAWAKEHDLTDEAAAMTQLVKNEDFQKEVQDDMARVAKEAELRGFEKVKKVHFHADAFSLEDNLITPTFKLKRPQLKVFFQMEIDQLYQQLK